MIFIIYKHLQEKRNMYYITKGMNYFKSVQNFEIYLNIVLNYISNIERMDEKIILEGILR